MLQPQEEGNGRMKHSQKTLPSSFFRFIWPVVEVSDLTPSPFEHSHFPVFIG
jgi:hypothetical protein